MSDELKTASVPGVRLEVVFAGVCIITVLALLIYIAVRIDEKDTALTEHKAREVMYKDQIELLNEEITNTRASIDKFTVNVCKQLGFNNPYEHDGVIKDLYGAKEGKGG